MEDEIIVLDIGGSKFKSLRSTLNKIPESKLGQLSSKSEHYRTNGNTFFFDRSPELFNVILDFYRCDESQIHPPSNVCGHVLLRELKYWEIPIDSIADCCFHTYSNYESEQNVRNYLSKQEKRRLLRKDKSSLQHRAWLFFDQPRSSRCAMIFFAFFMIMVLLSALISCLIPEPSLRYDLGHPNKNSSKLPPTKPKTSQQPMLGNVTSTQTPKTGIQQNANNNRSGKMDKKELNWKITLFISTRPIEELLYLDIFTNSFFALELLLHFIVCPRKSQYLNDYNNKIDVIVFAATVLYYIALLLAHDGFIFYPAYRTFFVTTNAIVMIKLLRMFRLTKVYTELLILILALKASIKELILLFVTFGIFSVMFGNIIYYMELSEIDTFPDVFSGIWWAVVTMTTVGYGDVVPKSPAGYITGVITSMSGLLILAMPIAIVVRNFDEYHKVYNNRSTSHNHKIKMQSVYPQKMWKII